MGRSLTHLGMMRLGIAVILISGALGAPAPDTPAAAAAGGYGAPSEPSCTLQRVEQPTGYGCQQDQECSTSYEEQCSTSYEQECSTKYEQKCETKYEDQCQTKYEDQCKTEYDNQCETKYEQQCQTEYDTQYEDKR